MKPAINLRFYFFPAIIFLFIFLYSCKKERKKETTPANETGTVVDIQGHVYNTVKIGNQWWMAENLQVTLYNDSSLIFEVRSTDHDTIWANQQSGAYCSVDSRFGLLYNWYAVNDHKKIAPKGWHIPNDEEWKELEIELGMDDTEASKTAWRGTKERDKLIKEKSTDWGKDAYEFVGTNESGFTALTGGCRLFNGTMGEGKSGYWWTSSLNGNEAWYRYLSAFHTNIYRYHTYKNYGFSVRCVKD